MEVRDATIEDWLDIAFSQLDIEKIRENLPYDTLKEFNKQLFGKTQFDFE